MHIFETIGFFILGCLPFFGIGLQFLTVFFFQSGGYFWNHRVAPTEAAHCLRSLDYYLLLYLSYREFQLRLPAVWGHWTTNCNCDSLSGRRVFFRPLGCSNWGCPPFEGIGLLIVTVILFQRIPTEAAHRMRALDYQLEQPHPRGTAWVSDRLKLFARIVKSKLD